MTSDENRIDELLAAALRGDSAPWPTGWGDLGQAAIERIAYHGIAGLLNERAGALRDWPAVVTNYMRGQGIALAMWEMRHKVVLGDLLGGLADSGVEPLLLKGTALAYDLYPLPATRARGDSDMLVAATELHAARAVFERLGYYLQPLAEGIADDLALQEVWSFTDGSGNAHHIDLHWQLLNAPALGNLLDHAACSTDPLPLPRLSPAARAMRRPLTLLHCCIHRALHLTSPYIVGSVTYYGGDRLVWARDIDLLARALTAAEWQWFSAAAIDQGVAAVCSDGLALAQRTLGSEVPDEVMVALGAARGEQASAYLLGAGQARRTWLDLWAIRGWRRKLAYVAARGLPPAGFMRGKYPELAGRPLALLHLQRMVDLIRPRPSHRGRR